MATKSTKWNSGPPPHIGWWNASRHDAGDVWRWWDGRRWSSPAFNFESSKRASAQSKLASAPPDQPPIMWRSYWPENARVPRINPMTGEVTGGKK